MSVIEAGRYATHSYVPGNVSRIVYVGPVEISGATLAR